MEGAHCTVHTHTLTHFMVYLLIVIVHCALCRHDFDVVLIVPAMDFKSWILLIYFDEKQNE